MNAAERKAFAESIKPAVKGESDKFSWRLYQRALKRGRERVFICAWNNLYGVPFIPDLDALKAGCKKQRNQIVLGDAMHEGGWFHGMTIQSITRKGTRVDEAFAYSPAFETRNWLDITDWFWEAYLARGRCIFHGDYAHSWLQINRNARKCAYCGQHQRRTVVTKKTIERREVWSSASTAPIKSATENADGGKP